MTWLAAGNVDKLKMLKTLLLCCLLTIAAGAYLFPATVGNVVQLKLIQHLTSPESRANQAFTEDLVRYDRFLEAGLLAFKTGDSDTALELLETAASLEQRSSLTHFLLGEILYQTGHKQEAIAQWRKSNPTAVARRLARLAATATNDKKPEQALEYTRLALSLDAVSSQAYYEQGRAYMLIDQLESAIQSFRMTTQTTDDSYSRSAAFRNMGQSYTELGDLESALSAFQEAVSLTPDLYLARQLLGDHFLRMKKYDNAEEQYRIALKLNPGSPSAYIRIGNIARDRGDIEHARHWYLEAVRVAPNSGRGEYALGVLLLEDDPELAAKYIERAIALGWQTHWVWGELAVAYDKLGNTSQAIHAYSQVTGELETAPQSLNSWIRLAQLYTEIGNHEAAYHSWQKVLVIDPENSSALTALQGLH